MSYTAKGKLDDLITLLGMPIGSSLAIDIKQIYDTIVLDYTALAEYLERLEEHNHNNQWVYPTLTDPPQLISDTGKWTLGDYKWKVSG